MPAPMRHDQRTKVAGRTPGEYTSPTKFALKCQAKLSAAGLVWARFPGQGAIAPLLFRRIEA